MGASVQLRRRALASIALPALVAVCALAAMVTPEPASALRSPVNPVTVELNWPSTWGKLRMASDYFSCEVASTCTSPQSAGIMKARRAVSVMPKLRTLGTLTLYVGAFELGWTIGRTIDTQWLHLSGNIGTRSGVDSAQWYFNSASGGYWILMLGVSGLGARASILTQLDGSKCLATGTVTQTCGNMNSQTRIEQNAYWDAFAAKRLEGGVGAWVDQRPLFGSGGCIGAVSTYQGCYVQVKQEDAMEAATGANGDPEPFVAQTTPNGNRASSVPAPSATPPVWTDAAGAAARAALVEDAATAQAGAGTSAETGTVSYEAGRSVDPTWDGYDGAVMTMPSCAGLTAAGCTAVLQAAGWVGSSSTIELGRPGAVLTFAPGAVVTTSPGVGVEITTTTEIEYRLNPDPLPLELPSPLGGETYDAYLARLRAIGWVGTAIVIELDGLAAVPQLGPDAPATIETPTGSSTTTVQRVGAPWLAPRVYPSETIRFTKNPPNTPSVPATGVPIPPFLPPDPGGPDECPCPIAPFDFSPLEVENVCTKFPFGAFCWISDQVALFDGAAEAPHVTFTHAALVSDLYVLPADTFRFDVDLAATPAAITDWFPFIRNLLGFTVWIVGLWLLGRRLLGVNTPDAMGATDDGSTWDDKGKYGGGYA